MFQRGNEKSLRTITLEEHFATPAFMRGPGHELDERVRAAHGQSQMTPITAHLIDQLLDLDDLSIADMDAAGIDMQVLSLNSPGVEQLDATAAKVLALQTNDFLGEAVRGHPNRFAGFAALPTAAPDIAAGELERTVRDYGFKGAVINGHTRGRYQTIRSSGRSWSVLKLSRSPSTYTRHRLRNRSSKPPTWGILRRK